MSQCLTKPGFWLINVFIMGKELLDMILAVSVRKPCRPAAGKPTLFKKHCMKTSDLFARLFAGGKEATQSPIHHSNVLARADTYVDSGVSGHFITRLQNKYYNELI